MVGTFYHGMCLGCGRGVPWRHDCAARTHPGKPAGDPGYVSIACIRRPDFRVKNNDSPGIHEKRIDIPMDAF